MSSETDQLKEMEQSREVAHDGRKQWLWGAGLILLGVFFLAQNFWHIALFQNWWALFIAIPAVMKLGHAWRQYQAAGRLTNEGRSSLIGGLFIGAVAAIFLFNLNWGVMWPIFLIIAGLGALLQTK